MVVGAVQCKTSNPRRRGEQGFVGARSRPSASSGKIVGEDEIIRRLGRCEDADSVPEVEAMSHCGREALCFDPAQYPESTGLRTSNARRLALQAWGGLAAFTFAAGPVAAPG